MDDVILIYIKKIEERKAIDKLHPDYATYTELLHHVYDSVKESLNRLYRDNKIEVGHTLNDKWIKSK